MFLFSLECCSFKVFVGFNETGSHVAKKISLAITLRYQAFYNQSASSNHGLRAPWLRKNALRLSQSALSNFCPACDKHHNTPLQNINTSVSRSLHLAARDSATEILYWWHKLMSVSHVVPNVNLFDLMFLLVDYGKVLWSFASELQQNSDAFSKEEYILGILTVL